jgi:NTP pyrophosphatase (non-canonical NTP hydrolase)
MSDETWQGRTDGLCYCGITTTPCPCECDMAPLPPPPSTPAYHSLAAAVLARKGEWESDARPDLSYYSNEMGGECGEAQNVVKKLERERMGMRGSRATLGQLAEELADVVICAYLVAREAGIDLEAAVPRKFNKTSRTNGYKTRMVEP